MEREKKGERKKKSQKKNTEEKDFCKKPHIYTEGVGERMELIYAYVYNRCIILFLDWKFYLNETKRRKRVPAKNQKEEESTGRYS